LVEFVFGIRCDPGIQEFEKPNVGLVVTENILDLDLFLIFEIVISIPERKSEVFQSCTELKARINVFLV